MKEKKKFVARVSIHNQIYHTIYYKVSYYKKSKTGAWAYYGCSGLRGNHGDSSLGMDYGSAKLAAAGFNKAQGWSKTDKILTLAGKEKFAIGL